MSDEKVFHGSVEDLFTKIKKEEAERLILDEEDSKRAFNCRRCNKHYIPKRSQWIFYKLCDECFYPFDSQKMAARFSKFFGDGSIQGLEDVDEWIKQNPA